MLFDNILLWCAANLVAEIVRAVRTFTAAVKCQPHKSVIGAASQLTGKRENISSM